MPCASSPAISIAKSIVQGGHHPLSSRLRRHHRPGNISTSRTFMQSLLPRQSGICRVHGPFPTHNACVETARHELPGWSGYSEPGTLLLRCEQGSQAEHALVFCICHTISYLTPRPCRLISVHGPDGLNSRHTGRNCHPRFSRASNTGRTTNA